MQWLIGKVEEYELLLAGQIERDWEKWGDHIEGRFFRGSAAAAGREPASELAYLTGWIQDRGDFWAAFLRAAGG